MRQTEPYKAILSAALINSVKALGFTVFLILLVNTSNAQSQYEVKYGSVRFHSEEPSEYISAFSNSLSGSIDLKTGSFLFRIPVSSFKGFNCPLLRLHFNTNSMESISYPDATFTGVLLDKEDLSRNGEYNVRAKGKLKIHGIEQYRIIRVHVVSKDGKISVDAKLPIVLDEHNIRTPKLVMRKMATEVVVDVTASLVASTE
jgi:hypothetical protein